MGHVFTFEYHQERADKAREDFARLGLAPFVDVAHRDAVADGFAITGDTAKQTHWADAVFLDLPNPAAAIGHAVRALKPAVGRLCTFSPCIEQVQATCEVLRAQEFHSIETIECLVQPLVLTKQSFDTITVPLQLPKKARVDRYELPRQHSEIRGHTSYLTFASAPQATSTTPVTAVAAAAAETSAAEASTATTVPVVDN
jgi:tRNA (adenine57-N1/adenine58-N1)-methyltransferase catalytic subunit